MQGDGHHVEEVLRHSRTIKDEARALVVDLREAAKEVTQTADIKGRMERHPYAMMAAALGAGYVLGGGLLTRMTAKMLGFGARLLLVPLLRSQADLLGDAARGIQQGVAEGYSGSEDGAGGL